MVATHVHMLHNTDTSHGSPLSMQEYYVKLNSRKNTNHSKFSLKCFWKGLISKIFAGEGTENFNAACYKKAYKYKIYVALKSLKWFINVKTHEKQNSFKEAPRKTSKGAFSPTGAELYTHALKNH